MSKNPSPREAEWPEGALFTVGHSTLPVERFIALLHTQRRLVVRSSLAATAGWKR
jgi:hypothetical protein